MGEFLVLSSKFLDGISIRLSDYPTIRLSFAGGKA